MIIPVDISCFISAFTFLIGGIFHAGYSLQLVSRHEGSSSYHDFRSLDPTYTYDHWVWLADHATLNLVGGVLVAIGWFLLAIPLLQVTMIMSMNGSRMMGLHSAVGVLAIGAATTELCANLIYYGSFVTLGYIAEYMDLDDLSTEGDKAGWKVLSLLTVFARGTTRIVAHIEYLFLAVIFALLFLSVFTHKENLFGQRWAYFGAGLSGLCLFSFIVQMRSAGGFGATNWINGILKIGLLPVWILWLGMQLPGARATAQEAAKKQREMEMTNMNLNENAIS